MQLTIKIPKACDCGYDDYCDLCECTHDDHCGRHDAENKKFASLYDTDIRSICMFVQQNPTYFENHRPQYTAIYKALKDLNDDYLVYTTLKLLSSLKTQPPQNMD
jgi:hypothetical protein